MRRVWQLEISGVQSYRLMSVNQRNMFLMNIVIIWPMYDLQRLSNVLVPASLHTGSTPLGPRFEDSYTSYDTLAISSMEYEL